ncbi:hypothetical protein M8J77_008912 [Diaphorina citri]|nr:hypothetical protein M8J77_008912 [Diaphorina citri]
MTDSLNVCSGRSDHLTDLSLTDLGMSDSLNVCSGKSSRPMIHPDEYGSKESSTQNERTNQNARTPCIVAIKFDNYKFGHAFSTSLAMPRDELAGFRSEATEFS